MKHFAQSVAEAVRAFLRRKRMRGTVRICITPDQAGCLTSDQPTPLLSDDPLENYDYAQRYLEDALQHLMLIPEAHQYVTILESMIQDIISDMDQVEEEIDLQLKREELLGGKTSEA
ncbi:hypothetical protein FACS18948_3090 [Clostridia bacterium]|nr:hypothetical protein FACS18948_3090 [Clostridia bacterium]